MLAGRLFARLLVGLATASGLLALLAWPAPVLATAADSAGFAVSPVLRKIRARGEVAVGVRTDFPPFGMLDAKGRPRGLEIDLAQEFADHLGVRLRLVSVTAQDRFDRLREGAVDLIIASAGDTPARRADATAVEPHYYGSGVNVLLRPEQGETEWWQLRGHTLCAVQGAPFNSLLTQRHHVKLHAAPSVSEALRLLGEGRCAGLLYSEAALDHLRRLPDWRHYRTPLASTLVVPWAVSIARSEQGTDFERMVGDALASWHREGTLIALEKKWGLKPSRFLQRARDRWRESRLDGTPVCARDNQGRWPLACRDPAFVDPQQAEGVLGLAMRLRDAWGIRMAPVGEAYESSRYLRSLVLTGLLAIAAIGGTALVASKGVRALQRVRAAREVLEVEARQVEVKQVEAVQMARSPDMPGFLQDAVQGRVTRRRTAPFASSSSRRLRSGESFRPTRRIRRPSHVM